MGALLIDQRARGAGVVEADTTWCRHCQAVLRIPRRGQREGAWCGRCGGPVCATPACAELCLPWKRKVEKKWEAMQRSSDFARSAGLVGG